MFYENYYWGMNPIWWFLWIVLLIWIFAIPYDIPGQRNRRKSSLDILRERFASGQINQEEYQAKKKMLKGQQPLLDCKSLKIDLKMKKLENKVVFITGGNSGIGKAACMEAAREGATVVVADLAGKNHKGTIDAIEALDAKCMFVPIDVYRIEDELKKMVHFTPKGMIGRPM